MAELIWFRMFHDMPDDAKIAGLTDAQFRLWVTLMCQASKSSVRGLVRKAPGIGLTTQELLDLSHLDDGNTTETVAVALTLFRKLGMISLRAGSILRLNNFQKRQRQVESETPDGVKKRVKKFREQRKKQHAEALSDEPCNGVSFEDETPREEQIREEEIRAEHRRACAREGPGAPDPGEPTEEAKDQRPNGDDGRPSELPPPPTDPEPLFRVVVDAWLHLGSGRPVYPGTQSLPERATFRAAVQGWAEQMGTETMIEAMERRLEGRASAGRSVPGTMFYFRDMWDEMARAGKPPGRNGGESRQVDYPDVYDLMAHAEKVAKE